MPTNVVASLLNPATGLIDCGRDVTLRFGDVVELPVKEHSLSEGWNDLANAYPGLADCAVKAVTIHFKDQELVWKGLAFVGEVFKYKQGGLDRLLTTSADFSRIKVQRHDPKTGTDVEFVVDSLTARAPDDLWLRDLDVIVVPEVGR